jgi:hypothetical protein
MGSPQSFSRRFLTSESDPVRGGTNLDADKLLHVASPGKSLCGMDWSVIGFPF